jgi:hypothetical protein
MLILHDNIIVNNTLSSDTAVHHRQLSSAPLSHIGAVNHCTKRADAVRDLDMTSSGSHLQISSDLVAGAKVS